MPCYLHQVEESNHIMPEFCCHENLLVVMSSSVWETLMVVKITFQIDELVF